MIIQSFMVETKLQGCRVQLRFRNLNPITLTRRLVAFDIFLHSEFTNKALRMDSA